MQSSGEHGVVVISFGSAIMHLNENVIQNIIAAVSRLRQKFIWKIQGNSLFRFIFIYALLIFWDFSDMLLIFEATSRLYDFVLSHLT